MQNNSDQNCAFQNVDNFHVCAQSAARAIKGLYHSADAEMQSHCDRHIFSTIQWTNRSWRQTHLIMLIVSILSHGFKRNTVDKRNIDTEYILTKIKVHVLYSTKAGVDSDAV